MSPCVTILTLLIEVTEDSSRANSLHAEKLFLCNVISLIGYQVLSEMMFYIIAGFTVQQLTVNVNNSDVACVYLNNYNSLVKWGIT